MKLKQALALAVSFVFGFVVCAYLYYPQADDMGKIDREIREIVNVQPEILGNHLAGYFNTNGVQVSYLYESRQIAERLIWAFSIEDNVSLRTISSVSNREVLKDFCVYVSLLSLEIQIAIYENPDSDIIKESPCYKDLNTLYSIAYTDAEHEADEIAENLLSPQGQEIMMRISNVYSYLLSRP